MSRTLRVVLGLLGGIAVFGFLLPYAAARWAILYLLSFGALLSPRWIILGVTVLLGVLGWLALRNRSNVFVRSLFVGGLIGLLGAVAVVPVLARRDRAARTERERLIFSSRLPLVSLQVLDTNGQTIWKIVALDGSSMVEPMRYGVVPAGFRQEVPYGKRPRPFHVDEPLRIEARLVGRIESRTGRASSRHGFQLIGYKGENRWAERPAVKSP